MDLKTRVLSGWTFRRALYAGLGLFMIVQAFMDAQWVGVLFGGYFASMGIFSFGCASGACYGANCSTETPAQTNSSNVIFEEIKNK